MSNISQTAQSRQAQSGKGRGLPRTLEEDRGAYVLDVIRAAGKDVDVTLMKIIGVEKLINVRKKINGEMAVVKQLTISAPSQAVKVLRWVLLWSGKSRVCPGDTFYKSRSDWHKEAGVSESNLKTAVKHLRNFPWWKDECRGMPWGGRAQWYTVNVETVLDEVLKVLAPTNLRLVKDSPTPAIDGTMDSRKVKEPVEGSPVDSTGLTTIEIAESTQTVQPDLIGGPDRVDPDESTVSSMNTTLTSTSTATLSHPTRAREVAVLPVQDIGEREDLIVGFENGKGKPEPLIESVGLIVVGDGSPAQESEPELSVDDLAEKLIACQTKFLPLAAKDRPAAYEIAQRAIDLNLSERKILELACKAMVDLSKKPGQFHAGLSAAAILIGKQLLAAGANRLSAVQQKQVDAAEVERFNQTLEETRQRRETESARQAADRAARQQTENERVADRARQLLAISAGRVDGVDPDDDLRSLDRLARDEHSAGRHSIEELQAAFEWFSENRSPGEPLGWSRVDYGWPHYMRAMRNPDKQSTSTASSVGGLRSISGYGHLRKA
jgi:hypothetical protein